MGTCVQAAGIDRGVFHCDGMFVVVEAKSGMFVTPRAHNRLGFQVPMIASIQTMIYMDELTLEAPGMSPITVPLQGLNGDIEEVQIWDSIFMARDQGHEVAAWLTEYLSYQGKGTYRLVRRSDDLGGTKPVVDIGTNCAVADTRRIRVVSQASLNLLQQTGVALPNNHFFHNIVIDGCGAYAELQIQRFCIGGVVFTAKPYCSSCLAAASGQRSEFLTIMKSFSQCSYGYLFGRDFVPEGDGVIRLGDTCVLLELT